MGIKSVGDCLFCKKTFSGMAITKHLESCLEKNKKAAENKHGEVFHVRASAGPFWINFLVDSSSTLKTVDDFLRDVWLECCGHLSLFKVGENDYFSHPQHGERGMNDKMSVILYPSLSFSHEYDFGTTTYLDLKCVSKREGRISGIEILARNKLPDFICYECKKPATAICTECAQESENNFLCDSCAKTHKCGEDMLMPVVNSPRMGECGYTGD